MHFGERVITHFSAVVRGALSIISREKLTSSTSSNRSSRPIAMKTGLYAKNPKPIHYRKSDRQYSALGARTSRKPLDTKWRKVEILGDPILETGNSKE
jgi:hypothetical protein